MTDLVGVNKIKRAQQALFIFGIYPVSVGSIVYFDLIPPVGKLLVPRDIVAIWSFQKYPGGSKVALAHQHYNFWELPLPYVLQLLIPFATMLRQCQPTRLIDDFPN